MATQAGPRKALLLLRPVRNVVGAPHDRWVYGSGSGSFTTYYIVYRSPNKVAAVQAQAPPFSQSSSPPSESVMPHCRFADLRCGVYHVVSVRFRSRFCACKLSNVTP